MKGAPRRRRGLLLGALAVIVPVGLAWWLWCGPSTTLVLVRHADRDGQLDALTAAGTARAQELAHVGMKAGFAAIYRSDTNRSRDTAAPLAAATGLTPIVYPANDVAPLVARIFADHRGAKVLVVGHSNTVPGIIQAAGGPALSDIAQGEFDDLFVLTVCRCGRTRVNLLNIQYGAASP
jgi:broad specificity phosphatase PhoE